jgi:hypothetical protein
VLLEGLLNHESGAVETGGEKGAMTSPKSRERLKIEILDTRTQIEKWVLRNIDAA